MEQVFASFGVAGFFATDPIILQALVLAATGLLLIVSLAVCAMAFRAAGASRRDRSDIAQKLAAAEELVKEARQLTAQTELAAKRLAMRPAAEPASPETSKEAETDAAATLETPAEPLSHGVFADEWVKDSEKSLATAREAATVPKSLLRSLMRRSA